MHHPPNRSLYLLLALMAVVGCNSADELAFEMTPAVVSTPTGHQPTAPSPTSARSGNEPEPAEPVPDAKAGVEYSPPFPDRRDLFEPPTRARSTVRRDDAGETVELKGFVHVDEPKVVLAIDGVISGIPEGGEKYGVQVIAIEPPSVVLQRGRNRWKATLE